jgi:hypothetical protein
VLSRLPGPDGKKVNRLLADASSLPVDTVRAAPGPPDGPELIIQHADEGAVPPGSSREQREAERTMLDILGHQLGLHLEPATIASSSGARIEVDGTDADYSVLVECWAHQGPPKSAQRHKVLADAFKLTWIASTLPTRPRLILCLADPLAAARFMPGSRSWAAQAFDDLRIGIAIVDLPAHVRQRVRAAQHRQYR